MPDTNSKTYDPKQDYHDPDKDIARNRYQDGKSFDPTHGHGAEVNGAEVNPDPEDQKPLPDDAYPADGDGEKA